MLKTRTVFVLGAGASFEVGLPQGEKLKQIIADKVNIRYDLSYRTSGENSIDHALRVHVNSDDEKRGDFNLYLRAGHHIHDAMPQALSIDNFIDQQNDEKIELCGKLGIVHSILEAERNSLLWFDDHSLQNTIDFNNLNQKKAWHNQFFRLLTEGCRLEDIAKRLSTIAFISFNYDRCLEHFLFFALKNYYRAQDGKIAEILSSLQVYHPYGTVGALPWQSNGHGIGYGKEVDASTLLTQAHQIKTFTESVDDKPFIRGTRLRTH